MIEGLLLYIVRGGIAELTRLYDVARIVRVVDDITVDLVPY